MLRVLAPLLLLAACASGGVNSPTRPAVNEDFTLRPGQTAEVNGATVRITFERVKDDSRCAVDVTCIWEGDATVVLKVVADSTEATREVHTNEGGDRSRKAPAGDYVVTLVRLEPAPRSTQPIEADAYRATLRVARE
jgi:hypothetical protein